MKNGRYENIEAVYWYLNNQLHREDGPAIERLSGTKEWYLNGQRHREDGPAIQYFNRTKEWCINGVEHSEEEFNHWLDKRNLNEKLQSFPNKSTQKRSKI